MAGERLEKWDGSFHHPPLVTQFIWFPHTLSSLYKTKLFLSFCPGNPPLLQKEQNWSNVYGNRISNEHSTTKVTTIICEKVIYIEVLNGQSLEWCQICHQLQHLNMLSLILLVGWLVGLYAPFLGTNGEWENQWKHILLYNGVKLLPCCVVVSLGYQLVHDVLVWVAVDSILVVVAIYDTLTEVTVTSVSSSSIVTTPRMLSTVTQTNTSWTRW